jgi:uncharacterized integral membrane protein (TIGR00698 family)
VELVPGPVVPVEPPQAPARTGRAAALLPGLLAAVVLTAAALLGSSALSRAGAPALSPVFLAIVGGLAVGPVLRAGAGTDRWTPGLQLVSKRLLLVAIVLLGLRFSIGDALGTGGAALGTVAAVIVTGLVVARLVGRWLSVDARLALLIGVGTAICGNSAIGAVAPLVRAREEEVSFASVVITGFGVVAMLAFPAIGGLVGADQVGFGIWAGAGIHDAAQAIAAGFVFGPEAGGVATVVKLGRTLFLLPIVAVLAVLHRERASGGAPLRQRIVAAVPWFAVGFLVAALVRSAGDRLVGGDTAWWVAAVELGDTLAGWLLVAAMAGMGLQTRLGALRRVGGGPVVAGLVAAVACAAVAGVGAAWAS